ncbi:hypothetical protein ACPC54_39885 [Kitasatospora sp. NPDC094028]
MSNPTAPPAPAQLQGQDVPSGFQPSQYQIKFGVWGDSADGDGVIGSSGLPGSPAAEAGAGVLGVNGAAQGVGVRGMADADTGTAVLGTSANGTGVAGTSANGTGVAGTGGGQHAGVTGTATLGPGVAGTSAQGAGVTGTATQSPGVQGTSSSAAGVAGTSTSAAGVTGTSQSGAGVTGSSQSGSGVAGSSQSADGVTGSSQSGAGVTGTSIQGDGVVAGSTSGAGLSASSGTGIAVSAFSREGTAVYGHSGVFRPIPLFTTTAVTTPNALSAAASTVFGGLGPVKIPLPPPPAPPGVSGSSVSGAGVSGGSLFGNGMEADGVVGITAKGRPVAGAFTGDVTITGNLHKGGGGFRIDHPQDPANRYLCHSFVESPERKNVYDGTVTLDPQGRAVVELPSWFEALNQDFHYQLTPLGAPAPGLYVAEPVSDNRFTVAGGTAGQQVCWQVTGVRDDVWAQAHPMETEEEKRPEERGYFLHPEARGKPPELAIAANGHRPQPGASPKEV